MVISSQLFATTIEYGTYKFFRNVDKRLPRHVQMANHPSTMSRDLPEGQNVSQLAKKFPIFYRTARFISKNHKSPPPIPILIQINPVYAPSHFRKIHFIITLQSTIPFSEWSPFLRSLHQNFYAPVLPPIRATFPAHLFPLIYHPNIWGKVEVISGGK